MLSVEEALLMQAVQDEIEREQAVQTGGAVGGIGGALIGAGLGSVPHKLGVALNDLRDKAAAKQGLTPVKKPMRRLKPGPRMAGGLTGLILGGGLGAGMAAMMKGGSDAGRLLGKIQGQGEMTPEDERLIAQMLGEMYSSPSQMM